MTEIKTSPALLDALARSAKRKPSAAEMEKQRVSFIMGSLPESSPITREQVQGMIGRELKQQA